MRAKRILLLLLVVTSLPLLGWFSFGVARSIHYAYAYSKLDSIRSESDILHHFGPPTRTTYGTESTIPELLDYGVADPAVFSQTPLTWYWYVPPYRIACGPWVLGVDDQHQVASVATWKKH